MWSADQLDRARVLLAENKVENVGEGMWRVLGSGGDSYAVATDGKTEIDCSCPAGKRSSPSRCYHAAAVLMQVGGLDVPVIDVYEGEHGMSADLAVHPIVVEAFIDEPDVDEVVVLYTGTVVRRHADGTWGRRRMSWPRIRDWAYGPLVTKGTRERLQREGCP